MNEDTDSYVNGFGSLSNKEAFRQALEEDMGTESLILYVEPKSVFPVWVQLCILWVKHYVFRVPYERL